MKLNGNSLVQNNIYMRLAQIRQTEKQKIKFFIEREPPDQTGSQEGRQNVVREILGLGKLVES